MPRIVPFLWFDGQAEEAMALYTSVFDDSRIHGSGSFELAGRPFLCLDGGPGFPHTPAISFYCTFASPDAARSAWDRLGEGGSVLMPLQSYPWAATYGWLRDRFGVSWQLTVDEPGPDAAGGASIAAPPPQRITPLLMFTGAVAGRAAEAMDRWTALFDAAGVDLVVPYDGTDGDTAGLVKHGRFHLGDDHFMAMESTGPHAFGFSEAISLLVRCRDQAEIDRYWAALTDGGTEGRCGWCTDAFGVSWQVVPQSLGDLLGTGPAAVEAMLGMGKIDVAALERAAAGAGATG